MNIFKEHYLKYLEKNLSVIPDRYRGKKPLITGWSDWCQKVPDFETANKWANEFEESNIAVCLGEASGIIALDIDTLREDILELIMPILPESPVTKIGAKGETRFFQYRREVTAKIEFEGECILEILSNGKKTTIAPSVHPNGSEYTWKDNSLLDVDVKDLPLLPPVLQQHVEQVLRTKFGCELVSNPLSSKHTISGRNNKLSSLCGKLIKERVDVNEALKTLVETDATENDPPLFSDPSENRHTEPWSNALRMYTSHLDTVNTRHFRTNTLYEVPIMPEPVNASLKEAENEGKSQRQVAEKKLKKIESRSAQVVKPISLPEPSGYLKTIQEFILSKSPKPQPALALGAAISTLGTMLGNRYIFNGTAPNTYVFNILKTGGGKQAPFDCARELLDITGHEDKIGTSDSKTLAGIMDTLPMQPVRLDLLDENSAILETSSKMDGGYASGISAALCKLWSSSNGHFDGRRLQPKTITCTECGTKETISKKGECYRPHVNILMATTPVDLGENISLKAIRSGSLARCLVFCGDQAPQRQIFFEGNKLDEESINFFHRLANDGAYIPNNPKFKNKPVIELIPEGKLKDSYIDYCNRLWSIEDQLLESDPLLAPAARLVQQFNKVALIHAAGRHPAESIIVEEEDYKFAYDLVLHSLYNFSYLINNYLEIGKFAKDYRLVKEFLKQYPEGTSDRNIRYHLRNFLRPKDIENVLYHFEESGEAIRDHFGGEFGIKLLEKKYDNN